MTAEVARFGLSLLGLDMSRVAVFNRCLDKNIAFE